MVCENFRPGTMEKWDLGPDDLDPRLVYVRISVFGQDGPYSPRPGLDRLGIAYGGLLHLTGEPDRPPVRPGVTISDYLTGVFAAMAAVAGLYRRDRRPPSAGGGVGTVIDAPLYGCRPARARVDAGRLRPAGDGTADGRAIASATRLPSTTTPRRTAPTSASSAGSDANFARLCRAMDRHDLLADPRFTTLALRSEHADEINEMVAAWTRTRDAADIEAVCIAHDVPVGTAYSAADIFADPHMAARGDLVAVDDPVFGPIRQQAPFPRFLGRPTPVPTGAPVLGAHNRAVWCDLVGLSDDELAEAQRAGTI